jgi:sulfite oxidase
MHEELLERENKSAELIVRSLDPLNAEPPLDLLRRSHITANRLFFVRNHAPVPQIDPRSYRLHVNGLVRRELQLSLDELRREFPIRTIVATLQCAGNRRQELMRFKPIPDEIEWHAGAIGTAEWRGVSLRDVLRAAEVLDEAHHVAFLGLDRVRKKDLEFGFGGSIPLEKALSPEVILAFEMNGEPLPPAHGFPLRVVVPGYIGARSVKWLGQITLQKTPSENYFQARAYKIFAPHVTAETADWDRGLTLGELPISSVICSPQDGSEVEAGPLSIKGYALSSGGRSIERVEVSLDGGESWTIAELEPERGRWAWRFWEATLAVDRGEREIVARAWDSAANTQPEEARRIWNFKGYVNNAWHRIRVKVK